MKLAWLCALAPVIAFAQDKNPFHGNKEAIDTGQGAFRIYCSPCHGLGGQGGRAPDLTTGQYSAGNSDETLHRVISGGAQGTEMPAFAERFNPDEIWRMVAYLRSIAGKPAPPLAGDRANGEKLYRGKGGCGGCHRVGGKGGRIGPDLSSVGRMRSLAYIKESLLDPNAALTPGYNTITVVTQQGEVIKGVQKGYDEFSAQLMDTSENIRSYVNEDVKSIKREFKSLMPPTRLAGKELDDLLVYLISLRGGPPR